VAKDSHKPPALTPKTGLESRKIKTDPFTFKVPKPLRGRIPKRQKSLFHPWRITRVLGHRGLFDIRHFGLTDNKKIERTPELSAALAQCRQKLQMSYVEH
jgi:hypothetical protein